jgi:hypothetical protein
MNRNRGRGRSPQKKTQRKGRKGRNGKRAGQRVSKTADRKAQTAALQAAAEAADGLTATDLAAETAAIAASRPLYGTRAFTKVPEAERAGGRAFRCDGCGLCFKDLKWITRHACAADPENLTGGPSAETLAKKKMKEEAGRVAPVLAKRALAAMRDGRHVHDPATAPPAALGSTGLKPASEAEYPRRMLRVRDFFLRMEQDVALIVYNAYVYGSTKFPGLCDQASRVLEAFRAELKRAQGQIRGFEAELDAAGLSALSLSPLAEDRAVGAAELGNSGPGSSVAAGDPMDADGPGALEIRLPPAPTDAAAAARAEAARAARASVRERRDRGNEFTVIVHLRNKHPDFFVPADAYQKAVSKKWQAGEPFEMFFAGSAKANVDSRGRKRLRGAFFGGRVTNSHELCADGRLPWECMSVVWDEGGTLSNVNPWELGREGRPKSVVEERFLDPSGELLAQARAHLAAQTRSPTRRKRKRFELGTPADAPAASARLPGEPPGGAPPQPPKATASPPAKRLKSE